MVSLTARFDPVSMDGATVSRAYLHNLDNFRALQLGSGDTVRVYRANMIIPQIARQFDKERYLPASHVLPLLRRGAGGWRNGRRNASAFLQESKLRRKAGTKIRPLLR